LKKGGTKLPDAGTPRRGKLDELRNSKISPKQANQASNRANNAIRNARKGIKQR
jgi:hypothetical protein